MNMGLVESGEEGEEKTTVVEIISIDQILRTDHERKYAKMMMKTSGKKCVCDDDDGDKGKRRRRRIYHSNLKVSTLPSWMVIIGCGILVFGSSFAQGLLSSGEHSQLQAPRFITQPSAAGSIVSEGRTKILQCQALGIPQPEYRWMKDGQYLGDFTSDHFYKIQHAKRSDAGDYQCIARNDAGAIQSEKIRVTVAFMTPFEEFVQEKTVIVRSGEAAVLELPQISSHPPPSILWQARDNSLLYGSKFATTTDFRQVILDANAADQKAYRARATNTQLGHEESSGFINLIVTGQNHQSSHQDQIGPEIIVPPTDAQIAKGVAEAELQCIANARPLYELETIWMKDGVPIEAAGISTSFNDLWNRTLSLIKVDASHGGEYSCVARLRNSMFPAKTASARVSILEKPHFTQLMPTEVYGEFGKEVVLHCSVGGVPKPNVTWLKDTSRIGGDSGGNPSASTTPGYSVDGETGSLTVHYLRAQDSGMYQCWASNSAGETNGYSWLRVKTSSPVMVRGPENRTVLEGNDITLFCEVGGSPLPNVTWYRNEREEIIDGGRFQILDSGSLLIAAVRSKDAGHYTCLRSNVAGTVIGSADISVLTRTQIIQPPVDTQVILGQVATLQCKVSSDPALPYDVEWEINDEPILPGVSSRMIVHLDGTLEIREVRAADVGTYKCIVRSQGGHDERVAQLKIIELPYPPSNVHAEKLPLLAPGANSKAVNISWTSGFDGNSPVLQYILQKRTAAPESSPGIQTTEILSAWETLLANVTSTSRFVVVERLKPATSYQFRLSAVNAVGEGEASLASNVVTLPQEPPSGPPVGLVGSARSPSQIIIQWHPPAEEARNGPILGYTLRYRLSGYGKDTPWSPRNISNEAQRSYLIEDLITWKDYEIQIAAYNHKGLGVFSPSLKVKTREGVPSASPTQVRISALNSTCVQAVWLPPDPQQINGINQGYKIQATSDTKVSSVSLPPSPFDPLAEQTGVLCTLDPFTAYNVSIFCFTNPGDGKGSPPAPVTTLEDVPEEVSGLHFQEISDRSVKVVWKRPAKTNGVLLGYLVRYGIKDIPSSFVDLNATSEDTFAKVTALKASTYYSFEVCGLTQVGRGACKSASIKSGVEPVLPKPPSNLAVSNIQPFSVVLQFTPGFDGNSSITKWTIQASTNRNSTWSPIFEHCEEPEKSSSVLMESIIVHQLTPFTSYKLRLVAHNVVGPSVPSEPCPPFETLQASPAHPPRNVTVRAMSASQLRVRWIPLQQTEWYGHPRGYNISYRRLQTPKGKVSYQTIGNPTGNSFVLEGLEEFSLYEVVMTAYNDVGASSPSFPAFIERTRESVPGIGPVITAANATSSTTIVVRWASLPEEEVNGILEGFKVSYGAKGVPFQVKTIPHNTTLGTTLTELKKFTSYHVQVLGYTRVGDGLLSDPPVLVQTWDDVPGPPSNISFPDVTTSTARMIWDSPIDPNGVVLAYRITYALEGFSNPSFSMEFPPETRTFRATELEREKTYTFSLTAKTRLGWGETAKLQVFTTNNRELPQAPSTPRISPSQVQATQITFSWTPGRDGFAPIRYYTVEVKENEGGHWRRIHQRVSDSGTSYTAKDLTPFTSYRFRIQATNDIGSSGWSPESNVSTTLSSSPSGSVGDVTVVPITPTSVRVTWKALQPSSSWNGDADTGGYRVEYRQAADYPLPSIQATPKEEIRGVKATSVVLTDLTRDKNYEISVTPFNSRGVGGPSRPVTVYVGEAVPTGEPRDMKIVSVSSTEVTLEWKPPFANQQNGDLLGYKIFYHSNASSESEEEELEVVPAGTTSHTLFFLEMFSEYSIRMAVFNPAGDGPSTHALSVRTAQGPPGPVANVSFYDITMTSLKLSWDKPRKPNGEISHYYVTYETVLETNGGPEDAVISKQVRQKVSCCALLVENLEEETSYTFSVRAKNAALGEGGPPIWKNVTTGPQPGSPKAVRDLRLSKMFSSVTFRWGNDEKSKIQGYYFEAKRRDENRWQTVQRTEGGPLSEFTLSFQNLLPSSGYTFRVTAYNKNGISYPVASDEVVYTPPKLYLEYGYLQASPFYMQTWFLVVIAAVSVIFIIALVAFLCVKTKSYKYKHESERSLAETASIEEGVLYGSSVELRQSQKKVSTLRRKAKAGSSHSGHHKPPPRPTPGSVTYTDDESDKAYDHNPDESSLTEKPSEISSTDSQGSETEVEDEVDGGAEGPVPHSFVNHYANVNDTLKQSWQKQRPVRNPNLNVPIPMTLPSTLPMPLPPNTNTNYSSYTDSEPEATASLSGQGRIVLNNMARSRAPLPGFSSFI